MTEALLLTLLGSAGGYVVGIVFSWVITTSIGVPLSLAPMSFLWATLLAARLRLPVRALSGRQGQPAVADGGAAL